MKKKINGADKLPRSFLLGRSPGEAVETERGETIRLLLEHHRPQAAHATSHSSSFKDYMLMRERMYAGGIHAVRLHGGRTIDRRGHTHAP